MHSTIEIGPTVLTCLASVVWQLLEMDQRVYTEGPT